MAEDTEREDENRNPDGHGVEEDENTRARRERDELIVEVERSRQHLEQVAGNFPHVNKGGPASRDLERAARDFAELVQRLEDTPEVEDPEGNEARAEDRALAAENALNANVGSLDDDENRRRPGAIPFNHERAAAINTREEQRDAENDEANADDAGAHERQDRLNTQEAQQATTRRRRDVKNSPEKNILGTDDDQAELTDGAEPTSGDALGAPAADAARG